MTEIVTVHECLFCPQTFDTAVDKDDHILQHFAQETCIECNQNLIRIGSKLFTLHDPITCIERTTKKEEHLESDILDLVHVQSDNQYDLNGLSLNREHIEPTFQLLGNEQIKTESFTSNEKWYPPAEELNDSKGERIKPEPIKQNEELIESKNFGHIDSSSATGDQTFRSTFDRVDIIDGEQTSKISCDVCGRVVGSKSALRKHSILLHSSSDTIFCDLCAKLFSDVEDRDEHRIGCAVKKREARKRYKPKESTKPKPNNSVRCDLCEEDVKTVLIYRHHIRMVHDPDVFKFKCDSCHLPFMTESSRQEHQCPKRKPQRKKSRIPCEICGRELGGKTALRKHMILVHSPPNTIFCNRCGRLFDDVEDRDVHRIDCTMKARQRNRNQLRKPKPKSKPEPKTDVQCDLCKKSFTLKSSLRKHMRMTHDPNVVIFKCDKCNIPFMKESWSQNHQCKYNDPPIPCDICGRVLGSQPALRKHKILLHSPPSTIFCDLCAKLFTAVEYRDAHRIECALKERNRRQERLKSKPVRCDLCDEDFKTDAIYRQHIQTAHDPDVFKFKCDSCHLPFMTDLSRQEHRCIKPRRNELSKTDPCTSHDAKHQRENNRIPCDICGKELGCKSALRKHQIILHSPPNTIFCSRCGRLFDDVEDRDAHKIDCDLKSLPVYAPGNFKCELCPREFDRKYYLQKHIRLKHDPNTIKFKCEHCHTSFLREISLQNHDCKSGMGRKTPKLCDLCGKKLCSVGSLRVHRIMTHSSPNTIFCNLCAKLFDTCEERDEHKKECNQRRKLRRQNKKLKM